LQQFSRWPTIAAMNPVLPPGIVLLLALFPFGALAAPVPVAAGTWLIPGGYNPGRQPDDNSVIWQAPRGLVVLDTGRHAAHSDAIIAFAGARPVIAIINSHWHLDHVSGNPRLKARWSGAKVYASNAIDDALSGFLKRGAEQSRAMLTANQLPPDTAEDVKTDLATIEHGDALKPDIVIDKSESLDLAGRALRLNLVRGAATMGDVWVYDARTKLVAAGDLVTLPVPFLDTACPEGWSRALGTIASTDFTTLIPGHGAPMTRQDFTRYRTSFDHLRTCAASAAGDCGENRVADTGPLIPQQDQKRAHAMIAYYVDVLRQPPPKACG
jgi:glyoxylase-like metal-dependent hydrolase (beta-lactamase superfamily II)